MMPIVPRVAIFSHSPILYTLKTTDNIPWFADDFEIHQFTNDITSDILVNSRFNLLVFIGEARRWQTSQNNHIPKLLIDTPDQLTGDLMYDTYISKTLEDNNPPISAFTPAFKTFEKFDRLYKSLKEQSISDWEWVILDDSPGDDNFQYMCNAVGSDHRVKIYKSNRNDALVGSTKRQAASLCNGDYLMEVDHDDELHHLAFEKCIAAFKSFPDAKFCYCDSAETFEVGGNVVYGDGFAMGEGIHYNYQYKGRKLSPANVPINASTVRHIVGVPNHFRCWERNFYHSINRHNNKLAVVDDYEIFIRTFLNTKIIHIPQPLYIQYMNTNGNNTQEPRRKEIQRLVDRIQKHYDRQIHDRIIELGGVDWMWNETLNMSIMEYKPPFNLKRSTLAYVYNI